MSVLPLRPMLSVGDLDAVSMADIIDGRCAVVIQPWRARTRSCINRDAIDTMADLAKEDGPLTKPADPDTLLP